MWPLDDKTQAFQALSYGDKLRVSRHLTRGEAPDNPHMAAAAVELAESYQRQSRTYIALMRWFPAFMVVGLGYVTISHAVDGDTSLLIVYSLIVVLSALHLLFNPAVRPKNMSQSLEASKRVVTSGRQLL